MAQTSGFFEAEWDDELYNEETQSLGDWDRKYLAEEFARYFGHFVPIGVMNDTENQLKVTAGTGMTVIVSPGFAFINGYWFYNDEQLVLDVPLNGSSLTRVDSVRLRWSIASRTIECLYVPNDIVNVRSDLYYDLQLAQVSVDADASVISDLNITDVRSNEDLCGLIKVITANEVGDLSLLKTEEKDTIVDAVNEIIDTVGPLSSLSLIPAVWRNNVVRAVNYTFSFIGNLEQIPTRSKTNLSAAMSGLFWNAILLKPFDELNSDDFVVETSDFRYYEHPIDGRVYIKTLKLKPKVISWADVNGKVFDTVDLSDFIVEEGQDNYKILKIRPKAISWSDIQSKPFSNVDGNTLAVDQNTGELTVIHSADDIIISNRKFTFSIALTCRINNENITANSLADVYFNAESINYAQRARISVETHNGYVELTALNTPAGDIYGTIRIRVV